MEVNLEEIRIASVTLPTSVSLHVACKETSLSASFSYLKEVLTDWLPFFWRGGGGIVLLSRSQGSDLVLPFWWVELPTIAGRFN